MLEETGEKIPVSIGIRLTPIGTLELWLKSRIDEHVWNLEFQLRAATGQENDLTLPKERKDETYDTRFLTEARQLIENLFTNHSIQPKNIIEELEKRLDQEKSEWSSGVIRGLWDPLIKQAPGRKKSLAHEVRWWNLAGFFLRPGFGYPLDDFRIKDLWKIVLSEQKQLKSEELLIQQWICYRRIAGGLNKGQQIQLANELLSSLFNKKNGKIEIKNKSELYAYSEKMRALASFERLEFPLKIRLGEAILKRIQRNEAESCDYWALGRLGARHLAYGSVGQVLPKEIVSGWIEQLLAIPITTSNHEFLRFTFSQLARRITTRELNISDSLINRIIEKDNDATLKDAIFQTRTLTQGEKDHIFGDHLPSGLILTAK